MRYVVCAAMAMAAAFAAGCVKVDLGKASQDWANVGKSWAGAVGGQGVTTPAAPAASQGAITAP